MSVPTTAPRNSEETRPDNDAAAPRHFSMIRGFAAADFITLGNGACGTGAVLALMQYLAADDAVFLWVAFALFPLALALDFADGRVARWRHRKSPLGKDLDSLADIISFGVAPAALGFAVGLRSSVDVVLLLYFVACGISRLARFNVTSTALADASGKVRYFEGTPIPTSLALVLVLFVCARLGRIHDEMLLGIVAMGPLSLHPVVLLFALSGSAMISKTLRIPKV